MTQKAISSPGSAVPSVDFDYKQIRRDLLVRRIARIAFMFNPIFSYFFLWVPIVVLVIFSFNNSSSVSSWGGFSTTWYEGILFSTESQFTRGMLKGLQNTLIVGLASTFIATTLGTMVALALERGKFPGKRIVDAVLYLPVVIPEITQAVSLAIFFKVVFDFVDSFSAGTWSIISYVVYFAGYLILALVIVISWIAFRSVMRSFREGHPLQIRLLLLCAVLVPIIVTIGQIVVQMGSTMLSGDRLTYGFLTIIIGHVVFSMSFVVIVVRARLADMNPRYEEAARDLGANEWRTFWRVTFPLILPGVIAGGLLAFTLSLDDYIVTFFNNGVGTDTLPLFVYGSLRQRVSPEINALSTLMLLASMVLVGFSLMMQNRGAQRS